MSVLRHSAALLIALLLTVMLQAQDNWDGVLDRYEEICGRCIELRGRISAGEAVPNAEVTKLLGELSRLRTLIQDSQGSMSAGQRKRFNTIKNRYESSTGGELSSSTPAAKKTEGTRATYKKNVTAPPAANVIRNLSVLPQGSSVPGLPFLLAAPAGSGIAAQSTPAPPEAPAPLYGPIRTDIIPIACFGVRPAFGLFGAVAKGHWGGYISARSTFTPTAADYTTDSDGNISGGGKFWGNGNSRYGSWAISAGAVWHMRDAFGIYAGAGFGSRILSWQDASGKWARVSDHSYTGPGIEAGLIASLRRFDLLAGASWFGSPGLGDSGLSGSWPGGWSLHLGFGYSF